MKFYDFTGTLHCTHYTTANYKCNYNKLMTLHHNYNSTRLQLQLRLPYTTLHPAVVGEVTTATFAATPENTTSTTCRSIQWIRFCHPWFTTSNLSYRLPSLKLPPPPCTGLLVTRYIWDIWTCQCDMSTDDARYWILIQVIRCYRRVSAGLLCFNWGELIHLLSCPLALKSALPSGLERRIGYDWQLRGAFPTPFGG